MNDNKNTESNPFYFADEKNDPAKNLTASDDDGRKDTAGECPHHSEHRTRGDCDEEHHGHHSHSGDHSHHGHHIHHSHGDRHRRKKKMKKSVKALITVVSVLLALLLIVGGTVVALFFLGSRNIKPAVVDINAITSLNGNVTAIDEGRAVTYNGTRYAVNENVVPIAFMGIDTEKLGTNQTYNNEAGQSDANMVLALNTATGSMTAIVIPRDTMVEINILDENGETSGIQKMQLCLSYTSGDGKETSCLNTVNAMSKVLCGINIDTYLSLDLKGIGKLTDAVGGIDVVSTETIADFVAGQRYHLTGEAAQKYVQARDTSKFNTDSLRRERQMQFIRGFSEKALSRLKNDSVGTVTELYNISSDYTCTNIDLSRAVYLGGCIAASGAFEFSDIRVLEGEALMGETYLEYYLDEDAVLETVLDVFYSPVS